MGTRSTYRFREIWTDDKTGKKHAEDVALVYFQMDGYPTGHPKDSAEWFAKGTMVNGIGMTENRVIFNGVGCLAAQFIAANKSGAGSVYLYPTKSRGKCGENYLYDVTVEYDADYKPGPIRMAAYENYGKRPKLLWEGEPKDLDVCMKIYETEEV